MSKRKKKKIQHSITKDIEVTKTYFDKFSEIARKTLKLIDLDPSLYDKFTKKQKKDMMVAKLAPPQFEAKSGHNVPRHYIYHIQKESHNYLKQMLIGDPELRISFYEYLTMGFQFCSYIEFCHKQKADCEQALVYKTIAERFCEREDFSGNSLMMPYFNFIQIVLENLSQFNYRMYGFELDWKELKNRKIIAAHIEITSVECKKKHFLYHDKYRPAFQIMMGNFLNREPLKVCLPYNKIYPNSSNDTLLSIYVQSHALQRLKERLDILSLFEKNIYLIYSVSKAQTVQLENGKLAFEILNLKDKVIGYIPFIIQDNCLFILTVLPVTSPTTPIGKELCKTLEITKHELSFCGMDKLSYFLNTDFDSIPRLKEALVKNDLWYLTELYPLIEPDEHIQRRAGISTRIFQTQQTSEEIINEIAEVS